MIWSSGIRERRNVQKAGGKGGGAPAQTAVSYTYSASFAIAFGEGPAEEVGIHHLRASAPAQPDPGLAAPNATGAPATAVTAWVIGFSRARSSHLWH
jgi:hypothetical protein